MARIGPPGTDSSCLTERSCSLASGRCAGRGRQYARFFVLSVAIWISRWVRSAAGRAILSPHLFSVGLFLVLYGTYRRWPARATHIGIMLVALVYLVGEILSGPNVAELGMAVTAIPLFTYSLSSLRSRLPE